MDFGEYLQDRIGRLRRSNGEPVPFEKVAELAGFEARQLRRYRNEGRTPDERECRRLASVLQVPEQEVLDAAGHGRLIAIDPDAARKRANAAAAMASAAAVNPTGHWRVPPSPPVIWEEAGPAKFKASIRYHDKVVVEHFRTEEAALRWLQASGVPEDMPPVLPGSTLG